MTEVAEKQQQSARRLGPVGALATVALAVLTAYLCAPHADTIHRQLSALVERHVLFWRPVPPGHRLPLGSHQAPRPLADGVDVLDEFPHPTEFYRRYLRPQRPALFRGLARRHPAFHKWTDEYLRDTFGKIQVDVEQKKKEDRTAGIKTMSLENFLALYKHKDIYIVDSIQEEFRADLILPRLTQCGGLQRALVDAVLWFSSGGTKSVLHFDELDNINCLLDGTKTFFLVDVDEAHHIDFDQIHGRYSSVDVESVDMYRFPGLRDVPWYNVTMQKGDCFYLPYKWPHQVYSYPSRNMAVNLWFTRLLWHNETDCEGKQPVETALADAEPAEQALVAQLEVIGRAVDYSQLTLPAFSDLYADILPEDETEAETAFDALDENGDGLVTLKEMYSFDAVRFVALFPREDQSP